jgi:N6-L-threonylcarbamoyladenine synthase
MITLGIETSCDDTAAALISDDEGVLAHVSQSQDAVHLPFGGIVPELASRAHLENLIPIIDAVFSRANLSHEEVDLVAATQGPGLIGSLLVGFSFAKSFAYAKDIDFVGVDHLAAHALSIFLEPETPPFPYLALIVSGGTSAIYRVDDFIRCTLLGCTRDDAAGEVFDKVARLLDLGYPGGPVISRRSTEGDERAFSLPRAKLSEHSYDFSFSGLKTAVSQIVRTYEKDGRDLPVDDICASFQQAVIDVLVEKTIRAAKDTRIGSIVLGGGVAANDALRSQLTQAGAAHNKHVYLPAHEFCTDNAAMIAFAGAKKMQAGYQTRPDEDVYSRSSLGR